MARKKANFNSGRTTKFLQIELQILFNSKIWLQIIIFDTYRTKNSHYIKNSGQTMDQFSDRTENTFHRIKQLLQIDFFYLDRRFRFTYEKFGSYLIKKIQFNSKFSLEVTFFSIWRVVTIRIIRTTTKSLQINNFVFEFFCQGSLYCK